MTTQLTLSAVILGFFLGISACSTSSSQDEQSPSGASPEDSPRASSSTRQASPSQRATDVSKPSEPTSTIIAPTQRPNSVNLEALLPGQLIMKNGCLWVEPESSSTEYQTDYPIIWPYGFSVNQEEDGVTVHDETGAEFTRVGETIELGGGEGPFATEIGCLGSGKVWYASGEIRVISTVTPTQSSP